MSSVTSDPFVKPEKGRNFIFAMLFFVVFQITYMVVFVNKVYFYDYRKELYELGLGHKLYKDDPR
jgi:hypothetical protein